MRELRHPSGLVQRVAVADLASGGADVLAGMLDGLDGPRVVYSDPPWSPGNEKWWRRHGGHAPPRAYSDLLAGWCRAAASARPTDVLVEQSINDAHRAMMTSEIARTAWMPPKAGEWRVSYGSPRRPNVLVHYGPRPLSTDPAGMHGEKMTSTALDGIPLRHGSVLVDPCTGLGMTSRMAHRSGCSFVGTELTPARLNRTIAWLVKTGYQEDA